MVSVRVLCTSTFEFVFVYLESDCNKIGLMVYSIIYVLVLM